MDTIIDFFSSIGGFVTNLIDNTLQFVEMAYDGTVTLVTSLAYVPSHFVYSATAVLTIATIKLILTFGGSRV